MMAYSRWNVCPIALSAVAMLNDVELDRLAAVDVKVAEFTEVIGHWTSEHAHPPLLPAWRGIDHVRLLVWTNDNLLIDVQFDAASGGSHLRYAGGRLKMGGTIPDTIRTGAEGADMSRLLPHPMFLGHAWSIHQEIEDALIGPGADLMLGDQPMRRLVASARAERDNVALAMRSLGLADPVVA